MAAVRSCELLLTAVFLRFCIITVSDPLTLSLAFWVFHLKKTIKHNMNNLKIKRFDLMFHIFYTYCDNLATKSMQWMSAVTSILILDFIFCYSTGKFAAVCWISVGHHIVFGLETLGCLYLVCRQSKQCGMKVSMWLIEQESLRRILESKSDANRKLVSVF